MSGDDTRPVDEDWHVMPAEVGMRLGRYELRNVLGAGGMGVVFEAIDPELDRAVAVKILRSPADTQGAGAMRLRREGVTMARMTHPNVIRVYDVGVAQGRVFVAMELVRGGTLADWAARTERTAEEVIATYLQAGRGLAAAHDAGLVHRDFKPQNVLVGDDGRVLVTDFGLARAIDGAPAGSPGTAPGSPTGGLTQPGAIEGTPAFMAPEQYQGAPVDARADQFSFCISLWRALAGSSTADSWTASTVEQGAASTPISFDPSSADRVPSRVRGALLRGLELAPERRFSSMHELLAQLEPRRPPSWPIWLAAGLTAVALAGLAVWTVVDRRHAVAPADPCAAAGDRFATIWNDPVRAAVRAAFAATGRSYAEASFRELERQLDARVAGWEAARRDNCEDTRVRREQSDAMMDLRAVCLQQRVDDVAAFVDELGRADGKAVDAAAISAATIGDVAVCSDGAALARRAALPPDPATRDTIAQLERELSAARASVASGRFQHGLSVAEDVVARARAVGYAPVLAAALAAAGAAQVALEQGEAARTLYEEAALIAEAGGDDVLRFHCEVALVRILGYQLERDADATVHAQRAEALLTRLGPDPRRAAFLARHRANVDWWSGRYQLGVQRIQEAIDIHEAIDPTGAEMSKALHLRAILESELQDPAGAVATETRARAIAEGALGARHPDVGGIMLTIGGCLRRLARYDEGRDALMLSLEIFEESYGADSLRVALVLQELATVYLDQGAFDDAVTMLRRGLAIIEQAMGADHSRTALMSERLGAALSKAGRAADAEQAIRRAIEIHTRRLGADSPATAVSVHELAKHFARIGEHARARDAVREALRAFDASQGPDSAGSIRPRVLLGDIELALGHRAAALAAYQRSLAASKDGDPYREEIEAKLAALKR